CGLELAHQDVPLAGERWFRVVRLLHDLAEILGRAPVRVALRTGVDDALAGQFRAVGRHDLLEECGAGLGFADVQEDPLSGRAGPGRTGAGRAAGGAVGPRAGTV